MTKTKDEQIKKAKADRLRHLSYNLSKVYASTLPGEEFHPEYLKNEKNFRKIVRSDNLLEREMKKYFAELSERVGYYIVWDAFQNEKKAALKDLIAWDTIAENRMVAGILAATLVYAIIAGGNQTEEDTKIDIGWSEKEDKAISFISKHSIKLAGQLTDTTISQVKASLKFSLEHGESTAEAAQRLKDYINNPKRAAVIAHTESVRAYSFGRLAVAEEVGADRKRWDATLKACTICSPLDGKVVKLDKLFGGEYEAPPAHPNCRCLVQIILKGEKV